MRAVLTATHESSVKVAVFTDLLGSIQQLFSESKMFHPIAGEITSYYPEKEK